MIKRVVAATSALIIVLLVGVIAGCGSELPEDAVAQVGATYLTQEQFDSELAFFEAQYAGQVPDKETDPEGYKEFEKWVAEWMVTVEIVKQKAASLEVNVTDEDVQAEVDTVISDSFGGDQAAFEEALAADNITLDQLKHYYKGAMLQQAAYEKVTEDVTTVPDEEIAAYYEENKDDYFVDEMRTARHILVSPSASSADDDSSTSTTAGSTTTTSEPTDADWAAALAEAQEIRADLVAGADWTAEAAKYSDDAGTKDAGGDLGTVTKGEMVQEFEDSVFSMAQDEISQPVKTIYGYHIIQVTGITPAKQYTLDEVKEDISATLVNEKKYEVWQEWLKKTAAELNVIYQTGLEPTTTTTVEATSTTAAAGTTGDTGSAAGETTTTSQADSSITTAAPESTTTTGAAGTTTTAKP